jgi:hypothetical protein
MAYFIRRLGSDCAAIELHLDDREQVVDAFGARDAAGVGIGVLAERRCDGSAELRRQHEMRKSALLVTMLH